MDTIAKTIIGGCFATGVGLAVGLATVHLIVAQALPDQYASDSIARGMLIVGLLLLGGVGFIVGMITAFVTATNSAHIDQTSARK